MVGIDRDKKHRQEIKQLEDDW